MTLRSRLRRLGRDCRGATILEFALIAPVLLAMLLGIALLGIVFYAEAGLRSTVEDAARYATIWPRPSQAQIEARITAKQFGMDTVYYNPAGLRFDESPTYDIRRLEELMLIL